jgi:hypothetical protein
MDANPTKAFIPTMCVRKFCDSDRPSDIRSHHLTLSRVIVLALSGDPRRVGASPSVYSGDLEVLSKLTEGIPIDDLRKITPASPKLNGLVTKNLEVGTFSLKATNFIRSIFFASRYIAISSIRRARGFSLYPFLFSHCPLEDIFHAMRMLNHP